MQPWDDLKHQPPAPAGNTGAVLLIDPSLGFEFVTFPAPRAASSDAGSPRLLVTAVAVDSGTRHHAVAADEFSSPIPVPYSPLAQPTEGVRLPLPHRSSPFAAAAGLPEAGTAAAVAANHQAHEAAGPAMAERVPSLAEQAMQQVRGRPAAIIAAARPANLLVNLSSMHPAPRPMPPAPHVFPPCAGGGGGPSGDPEGGQSKAGLPGA